MECNECGASNESDAKFCEECGKKIVKAKHHEKKAEKSDKKTESHHSKRISHNLVPWLVLLGLLVLSAILLLPTKIVGYTVDIPYTATEEYSVDVPYEAVEPYTVQVAYQTTEQYVETVPVTEEDCSFFGLICSDKTSYRDVVKERPVTKYKDETRYRTVTKIRTEVREREVQKVRKEIHYKEANWIWGFDAVITWGLNLPPPRPAE